MNYSAGMTSVHDICDTIGRARLAKALGVTKGAITNGVANGTFPSRWYLVVKDMCAAKGVNCPDALFSFVESGQQSKPFKANKPPRKMEASDAR